MNNVSNVEKTSQSSFFFEPQTLDKVQLSALKVAKVAVVALAAVTMFAAVVGVSLLLPPLSPLLFGAVMIGGSAVAGAAIGAITGGVIAAIDNKAQQILSRCKASAEESSQAVMVDEGEKDPKIEKNTVSNKTYSWRDKAQEYQTKCDTLKQGILRLWGDALRGKQPNALELGTLYERLIMLNREFAGMSGLDQSLLDKADLLFAEAERLWEASKYAK